jgi:heme-degrading monooxygenase HmoA
MKAHMTNGTIQYLQDVQEKHPELNLFLMLGTGGGLAYYEDHKEIFTSGRSYEILVESGTMQEEGFVIMNNIPATSEGRFVLEDNFRKRDQTVEHMPGFQAFRFLKPLKGNTYVVLTQWRSAEDYENWKDSEQFKQAHKDQSIKKPAYFADRPFTTTYNMYVEDEEE